MTLRRASAAFSALAVVALAVSSLGSSPASEAWTPPLLALSLVSVLVLPGFLLLRRLGVAMPAWQSLPLSVGASLMLLASVTVLAIELHWNALGSAWLVLGATLLLGAPELRPEPQRPEPVPQDSSAEIVFRGFLLMGVAALVGVFCTVGGTMTPDSLGELREEALHIGIVRKLAENAALARDNLMYKPGAANTYVYPPYHFALALIARLSRVDPLLVYLALRPFTALASLLSMHSLALVLFRRRFVADVALAVLLLLVFNNAAGQVVAYYWAQLVPLSHLGDFGLGVMLPLLALYTLRYLADDAPPAFLYLTPAMMATGLLVHTREVLQLLFYLTATLIAHLVLHRDRRRMLRLTGLIGLTVILGLSYKVLHGGLAAHAVEFEAAKRLPFQERLAALTAGGLFETIAGLPAVIARADPSIYALNLRPFFLLALVTLPVCFLWRRSLAGQFLGASLLASALVVRIPHLFLIFTLATYAEMLMTPARYFAHWSYLLLAGGIGFAALGLDTAVCVAGRARSGSRRAAAAAIGLLVAGLAGLGLAALLAEIRASVPAHLDRLYAFGVLGSLACIGLGILAQRRFGSGWDAGLPERPARPWLALPMALALAWPLQNWGDKPSLADQYRSWSLKPSYWRLWDWYAASPLAKRLPVGVVRFLRSLTPGRLLAAPYDTIFAIPVMANHYVISCGYPLSTEIDLPIPFDKVKGRQDRFAASTNSYQARMDHVQAVIDRAPLFYGRERPEETIALLREYGVEYLVSPPEHSERLDQVALLYPRALGVVFREAGHVVYRVRREGL